MNLLYYDEGNVATLSVRQGSVATGDWKYVFDYLITPGNISSGLLSIANIIMTLLHGILSSGPCSPGSEGG